MSRRRKRSGVRSPAASGKEQRNGVTEVTDEEKLAHVYEAIAVTVTTRNRAIDRLDELVDEARRLGGSWSQIGRAADLTPQGAHRKWRDRDS